MNAQQIAKLLSCNRNTVNGYFSLLRSLVISYAIQEREDERISNGVEIDESYFGSRRQRGKRGRGATRRIAVLGLLKRNGKVYAQIVPDASQQEILLIIRATVKSPELICTQTAGDHTTPLPSLDTITRR